MYRFMTILFQILGSNVVITEALLRRPCEVCLDTHGHPFTYWFIYLIGGIKVIPYVHYPVLSTDMIQRVRERRPTYNNSERIAEYVSVSKIKLVYYAVLMNVYKLMGRCVEVAMCNSTWTKNHISQIWTGNVMVVYPPCDVEPFLKLSMAKNEEYKVISIGQFRPEKDHFLQIEAMNTFINAHPEFSQAKMLVVGSCRNQQDEALVASLKAKVTEYNLERNVEFHLNLKFPDLLNLLEISHIGIHTMWNEHFGIGVIEMMAAGLVTIANNSGGPREDIIQVGKNGFLATTPNEYGALIYTILSNFEKYEDIRTSARKSSRRYDESIFMNQFREVLYGVLGR